MELYFSHYYLTITTPNFNSSTILASWETSLHYVPLQTLMVLLDQNKFHLNKTGLPVVDTWRVHPNSTLMSWGCLDVIAHTFAHGQQPVLQLE